jgi:hypothetical protein
MVMAWLCAIAWRCVFFLCLFRLGNGSGGVPVRRATRAFILVEM